MKAYKVTMRGEGLKKDRNYFWTLKIMIQNFFLKKGKEGKILMIFKANSKTIM